MFDITLYYIGIPKSFQLAFITYAYNECIYNYLLNLSPRLSYFELMDYCQNFELVIPHKFLHK